MHTCVAPSGSVLACVGWFIMMSSREHFGLLSFCGERAQSVLFDGDVFVAVSNSAFMFPLLRCLGGASAPPHQTNPAFFSPAACCHICSHFVPTGAAEESKSEIALNYCLVSSLFLKSGVYVTQPQFFIHLSHVIASFFFLSMSAAFVWRLWWKIDVETAWRKPDSTWNCRCDLKAESEINAAGFHCAWSITRSCSSCVSAGKCLCLAEKMKKKGLNYQDIVY